MLYILCMAFTVQLSLISRAIMIFIEEELFQMGLHLLVGCSSREAGTVSCAVINLGSSLPYSGCKGEEHIYT